MPQISKMEISKSGDIFHDILRHKPHEVIVASPDKVHDCELHEGERGVTGSVISWHFTHGTGKGKFSKQIIESVNEENHMIVFKVIEGELVDELYKCFVITWHVEPKGDNYIWRCWVTERLPPPLFKPQTV
ncbi:putative Bet v I/Major latex protein [Helianthus annuus]|nr:putative Bet v I/Major latex protein [Helianthus annuus]